MTREEAIGQLTRLRSYCSAEAGTDDRDAASIWKADAEALSIAIAALNGPTRKMVERFAEEWQGIADGYADGELVYDMWSCSNCGYTIDTDEPDDLPPFCPVCGAPMTDEAVDALMKRMELIQNEQSPA